MSYWFAHMFGYPSQESNRGGEELPVSFDTEPLEGYRTWRIRPDGNGSVMLTSLIQTYRWQVWNTAECPQALRTQIANHAEAPGQDCVCGFYAQLPDHPFDEWLAHVQGRVHATGQVALYGRIIVCERGFKAQHAELMSPVFVDVQCRVSNCDQAVTRVRLPDRSSDYWGHCVEHGPTKEDAEMVDVGPWMRQALEDLTERYPSIEFLTFQEV